MYCRGWLWWMTILQVGQVLFSSRYFTRQLRQTEGGASINSRQGHSSRWPPAPGHPGQARHLGPPPTGDTDRRGKAPSRPSRGARHSSEQINSTLA